MPATSKRADGTTYELRLNRDAASLGEFSNLDLKVGRASVHVHRRGTASCASSSAKSWQRATRCVVGHHLQRRQFKRPVAPCMRARPAGRRRRHMQQRAGPRSHFTRMHTRPPALSTRPQGVVKPGLERLCEAYRTKASQLGQDLVSLHEARAALAERNHEKGEENTALAAEVGAVGARALDWAGLDWTGHRYGRAGASFVSCSGVLRLPRGTKGCGLLLLHPQPRMPQGSMQGTHAAQHQFGVSRGTRVHAACCCCGCAITTLLPRFAQISKLEAQLAAARETHDERVRRLAAQAEALRGQLEHLRAAASNRSEHIEERLARAQAEYEQGKRWVACALAQGGGVQQRICM